MHGTLMSLTMTLFYDMLKKLSEENITSIDKRLSLLHGMLRKFLEACTSSNAKGLSIPEIQDDTVNSNKEIQEATGCRKSENGFGHLTKQSEKDSHDNASQNEGSTRQVLTKTKDKPSGYSTDSKKKKKDEANKNQHGLVNCNTKLQEAIECRETEIGSGHFTDTSEKDSHDNASQKDKNQHDKEKCNDEFQEATRYHKAQIGSGDLSDKPERASHEITSNKDEKQHERGMYNDENQEGKTSRNTQIISGNLDDKPEKTSQDITGQKYDIKDEKNTTTYRGEYDASDESSDNISKRDKKNRKNKNRSSKDPIKSRNSEFADKRRHAENGSLQTDRNLKENFTVHTKTKDITSGHSTDTKKKWKYKAKNIKNEKNTTTYGGEYDASDESTDNISKRDKKNRNNNSRSSKDPSESRNSDFADIDHETKTLTYREDDSSNESSDSICKKGKIKRRNRRHSSKMPREDRKCDISDIDDEKKTTTYREIYDTSNESSDSISKRDKIKRRKRRRSSKETSENCDGDISVNMVRYPVDGHLRTGGDIKGIDTGCLKAKDIYSGHSSDDYMKTQKDKANGI